MSKNDILLDENAACKVLGGDEKPLSPKTLQSWRFRGYGPPWIAVGRLCRYRLSDLEAFLNGQIRHSTSDRGHTCR